jgi:hypothetical protein
LVLIPASRGSLSRGVWRCRHGNVLLRWARLRVVLAAQQPKLPLIGRYCHLFHSAGLTRGTGGGLLGLIPPLWKKAAPAWWTAMREFMRLLKERTPAEGDEHPAAVPH